MANPQLENGHLRIAHEVWEHLMRAGLSGSEHDLVMAVIRQTWGWKKKEAEISLAEFQELTGQPERTTADSLKSLAAKHLLIHSKGGGRGVKSKWSFNKDWESWISLRSTAENENANTLQSIAEKKDATINSAEINTVLNRSQTLRSTAEFSAENRRVSGCNSLPGLEHESPKSIFKERKANQASSKPAGRDAAYDFFAEAFEQKTGTPYIRSKGDFIQLAALRKSLGIGCRKTPPDWEAACQNYINSPMGSYSIAWMVTSNRFAVLRKSQVDRFGKPVDGSGNGHRPQDSSSLEERNRRAVEQASKELGYGS